MKAQLQVIRYLVTIGFLVLVASIGGTVSAQTTFPLGAVTVICDPGYAGAIEECTPWEGVFVNFTSSDSAFTTSCVTSSGGCGVDVPFGSTITASIDPVMIPDGYVLDSASSQDFTIPDGPPEGFFGGPVFVLLPAEIPPVDDEIPVGTFSLTSFAAYCSADYLGVFDGCTPWAGVTISFVSSDGSFAEYCTTAAGDRAASCVIEVPFGATINASIGSASIPAGYALEGNLNQEVTIPDGPPDGIFGGPSFVLIPQEVPDEGFALGAATAYCEPGYLGVFDGCTPWEGVTVTFVSSDSSYIDSCVTSGTDRAAGCSVTVPYGSTITASIDKTVISTQYTLEGDYEQTFEIPSGPPEGEFIGPVFVLLPTDEVEDLHDRPVDLRRDRGSIAEPIAERSAVVALPKTGSGAVESFPVMPSVLIAGALLLSLRSYRLRRSVL